MKAKTPKSWTVKSRIFSAQTIRDSAYDFEQNTYSATPAILYLCWQPVSASAPIEERGRVLSAGYQAVLYDPVGVRPGDLVQADGIGWTVSWVLCASTSLGLRIYQVTVFAD